MTTGPASSGPAPERFLAALELLVPEVIETMRRYPEVPGFADVVGPVYWLEHFPNDSCDIASLTLATVLFHRGLGDWNLVSASDDDRMHTWLRLVQDGTVQFSIDATLQQFPDWSTPWVGAGDSPAAERFTRVVHNHVFSRLPIDWPRKHQQEVATWTLERMQ